MTNIAKNTVFKFYYTLLVGAIITFLMFVKFRNYGLAGFLYSLFPLLFTCYRLRNYLQFCIFHQDRITYKFIYSNKIKTIYFSETTKIRYRRYEPYRLSFRGPNYNPSLKFWLENGTKQILYGLDSDLTEETLHKFEKQLDNPLYNDLTLEYIT